jgi:hypothetical protein
MDELNYHQALVEKGFGEGGTVSFDYTSRWGRQTLRQALWMRVHESRWVDRVTIETYERVDEQPDFGFHFALGRNLGDILHVAAGVADVDPNYGLINSDAFWYGRRVYVSTSLRLGAGADFFVLLHHGFANSADIPLHRGVQAGLRYDLKTLFRQAR